MQAITAATAASMPGSQAYDVTMKAEALTRTAPPPNSSFPIQHSAFPRSRFPGDILLQLRTDTLGFLTRTARTYGDAVPFRAWNWRYLLLNDPEAIRDVLVTRAGEFLKGPALRRATSTLGQGLLTSEGDFHRRQRRLAQPAFHPQRVAGYGAAMAGIAARTSDEWEKLGDGRPIDAHEEMMRLTLRIVAKTLFDSDVESEVDALGKAMNIVVQRFIRAVAPWGPLMNHLPTPGNFRFKRARRMLIETVQRFVAERRAESASVAAERGDLLSLLLQSRDDEESPGREGMSDDQLRDETLTLFTAGHETTANALTFTWHLLAQHPNVETKLHEELERVLGGRLPAIQDLEHLRYTRAVLAESMRLYPPAWAVAREANQDMEVGGRQVAAGTIILMSQWVTHRDARWWPEPESFEPNRWLPGEPAHDPNRPRYAYYPFGGGPRICIGEAFAWSEGMLALATLAQKWELRPASPGQQIALQPTITLRPKAGLPMVLQRRSCRRT
jgi:cytochrome P450